MSDNGASSRSASEASDEEGWQDADQDDDEEQVTDIISLLDDRVFSDALTMLNYCKEQHGLDFLAIRDRLGLDFHGSVKLINFSKK